MTRDEELTSIRKAQAGDPEAMRLLIERYQGPLMRFLLGLTNDEYLTEDLAQEAMLRAFTSLENFRPEGTFRSWLFGIAYHIYVDHLRKRRETPVQDLVEEEALRRTGVISRLHGLRSGPPDAEEEERQEQVLRLRQALEELPPEYRVVLAARYLDEMPRHEIASLLGISEYNVKMRLYRAKKELVRRFQRKIRQSLG